MLVELSVMEQRLDAVMSVLRELKVTEAAELAGTIAHRFTGGSGDTRRVASERSPTGPTARPPAPIR